MEKLNKDSIQNVSGGCIAHVKRKSDDKEGYLSLGKTPEGKYFAKFFEDKTEAINDQFHQEERVNVCLSVSVEALREVCSEYALYRDGDNEWVSRFLPSHFKWV